MWSVVMATKMVNGTELSYEETGKGMPVVLLHGFPLDLRVWEAQVAALADRWRVIAVDMRGFGKSRSDAPFTIESLGDDVHALLGEIKALPCVLGGLSMGGYVALGYAKKYPADLKGLMLIDTRAEADTPEGKAARGKMIEAARSGGSKVVAEQMMAKMVAGGAEKGRPEVVKKLKGIMEACPPRTIENALVAMREREDYTSSLASIGVPTLIVVGEQDAITPPEMAERMNREIRNSMLAKIKGAGHMAIMEQPEQVNAAMRKWLGEIG